MSISDKVMQGELQKVLLVATLALGSVVGESVCRHRHTWWDRQRQACVPCTPCDRARNLVIRYPCEVYRDTVCQTLHIIDNDTQDSESDYEYYDSDVEVSDSETWDLQTSTLALAVSGCVVFFVVVLSLWLYHAKQMRIIKRALESDMQEFSAKLRLMEAGDAAVEPVAPTDHHIYCNIHVGKDALLGRTSTKKSNVYTQEKH
ncbi:tumor necrosis factor receptor superfamily member wengen [Cydia fagiglandana]|uniref:tumor necrosis factor receptor superfamily member wengen n=1 Tax=Cydia fagiglandana TaxID=1458189 RepID=UPI002FEDF920